MANHPSIVGGSTPMTIAMETQALECAFPRRIAESVQSASQQNDTTTVPAQKKAAQGARQYWDPPDLDYSMFLVWLDAERALNERMGAADIKWRTEAMDLIIEKSLTGKYERWAIQSWNNVTGSEEAGWFFNGLVDEIGIDKKELRADTWRLNTRRTGGRDGYHKILHELRLTAHNMNREAGLWDPNAERDAEEGKEMPQFRDISSLVYY